MLKQAAYSVQSALTSMQTMLDNPCNYTFSQSDKQAGQGVETPIDLTEKNLTDESDNDGPE